jgi:hypothetical protein
MSCRKVWDNPTEWFNDFCVRKEAPALLRIKLRVSRWRRVLIKAGREVVDTRKKVAPSPYLPGERRTRNV